MLKRHPWRFLLLATAGLAVAFVFWRHEASVRVAEVLQERVVAPVLAVSPAGPVSDVAAADAPIEKPHSSLDSKECVRKAADIADLPTNDFVRGFLDKTIALDQTCKDALIPGIEGATAEVKSVCAIAKVRLIYRPTCQRVLRDYRSLLVDHVTKDQDLRRLSSENLADKAMARFYNPGWSDPVQARELQRQITEIADELLTRGVYENYAMKLKFSTMHILGQGSALETGVDQALKRWPEDPELRETRWELQKKSLTSAEFLAAARERVSGSSDAATLYWLAAAYRDVGQRDLMIATLERAALLKPDDARIRGTLDRIERGGKATFTIQYSPPEF